MNILELLEIKEIRDIFFNQLQYIECLTLCKALRLETPSFRKIVEYHLNRLGVSELLDHLGTNVLSGSFVLYCLLSSPVPVNP